MEQQEFNFLLPVICEGTCSNSKLAPQEWRKTKVMTERWVVPAPVHGQQEQYQQQQLQPPAQRAKPPKLSPALKRSSQEYCHGYIEYQSLARFCTTPRTSEDATAVPPTSALDAPLLELPSPTIATASAGSSNGAVAAGSNVATDVPFIRQGGRSRSHHHLPAKPVAPQQPRRHSAHVVRRHRPVGWNQRATLLHQPHHLAEIAEVAGPIESELEHPTSLELQLAAAAQLGNERRLHAAQLKVEASARQGASKNTVHRQSSDLADTTTSAISPPGGHIQCSISKKADFGNNSLVPSHTLTQEQEDESNEAEDIESDCDTSSHRSEEEEPEMEDDSEDFDQEDRTDNDASRALTRRRQAREKFYQGAVAASLSQLEAQLRQASISSMAEVVGPEDLDASESCSTSSSSSLSERLPDDAAGEEHGSATQAQSPSDASSTRSTLPLNNTLSSAARVVDQLRRKNSSDTASANTASEPAGTVASAGSNAHARTTLYHGRFAVVGTLASQRNSTVYFAVDTLTDDAVVIKGVLLSAPGQPAQNELRAYQRLAHAGYLGVMRLHFEEDKHCFIVLQHMTGGTLFDRIKPQSLHQVTQRQARQWMLQLVLALQEVHAADLVHGDVKPENCLLDEEGNLHLHDFGSSVQQGTIHLERLIPGTELYMSPESFHRAPCAAEQDIWALGLVWYAVLFADLPWDRARPSDLHYHRYCVTGRLPGPSSALALITDDLHELLLRILAPDPTERPSLDDIWGFLAAEQPWFRPPGARGSFSRAHPPHPLIDAHRAPRNSAPSIARRHSRSMTSSFFKRVVTL
ncbi:uncharacterized protein MONBRDRAFT_37950 [Monosiga brevicollis MX1]|uniref:Protein kinase domain-containing protein n=1 Tax=Monosiga brevicollis TaxID=81824 RepID=A9V4S3_MONBE|nr:uncharacterized protein MONBRDRAFT_37950 [Monosiga brevicollis MX1]EDQ87503.1 predicted protein [Monosiga brevicollis MX1]|eukprot:XP_001747763.1 hypothetical protein [Monosiga brevicollis MX1]